MISLTRDRCAEVVKQFSGETKRRFERELLFDERRLIHERRLIRERRLTPKESKKRHFNNKHWSLARKQLLVETEGKCAYCEAPTSVVAYGDVEHYRPKSIYWWLAYSYDNYLASCVLCNQKYKKDHFPIQNSRMQGPEIQEDTPDCCIENRAGEITPDPLDKKKSNDFIFLYKQEGPLLLNPYFDCPERYFIWRASDALREVEILPNPENPDLELIADTSIKIYGLGRQELNDHRYTIYKHYSTYKQLLNNGLANQKSWNDLLKSIRNMKAKAEAEDIRLGINESYDKHEQLVRDVRAAQQAQTNNIKNAIEKMKAPEAPFAGMVRYFDTLEG